MTDRRIIHPLCEVRFHMNIALSVTPHHLFKALWQPNERARDRYREELIDRLTRGWDGWQIVRELREEETAQLESLLSAGRVLPLPPSWK